ncbi:MAG: TonB-dependent receptor [Bacteroidales bacterium]|nr:TonB-dependent receptor [Bacteroidales bacterium]
MKRRICLFFFKNISLFVFFILSTCLQAQKYTQISGKIVNEKSGEPLVGVNIVVKNTHTGTASDDQGNFILRANRTPPFTLQFSMIGFHTYETVVTQPIIDGLEIRLAEKTFMGKEVIVTAPLVKEKVFKATVSLERLDLKEIQESPAAMVYDALAYMKGIDVATQGLQFTSVNARGFNATGNIRFVQMVDGMDNQAPGLNFPIGNIAGISELDLESIELMTGPSSALYGPNALNGILLMRSKDPFRYQGLSAYSKVLVNHIGFGSNKLLEFQLNPIIDLGIRYAKAHNNKWAYKINTSFMRGEDWHAEDFTNTHVPIDPVWGIDPETGEPEQLYLPVGSNLASDDPGYDGLNIYGDEIRSLMPVGEGDVMIDVARTGYKEEDLVNYNTWNFKLNGALFYRLTNKITAILQGNYGIGTTVYTGDNRISLDNFGIFQGKIELNGDHFFIRGYSTQQQSGDSYDARYLAINMNRSWKNDENWNRDFLASYRTARRFLRYDRFNSYLYGRTYADSIGGNGVRPKPGTPKFDSLKDKIKATQGILNGAKIVNNSALYHVEGSYDLKDKIKFLNVKIGGNYRLYDLVSDGDLFPDTLGNNITMSEYGLYGQLSKLLFKDKLNILGSLRYDKNENFTASFSPRLSLVYTIADIHSFRTSYQTGSRNPGSREQFIYQNLGPAWLIGGYPGIVEPFEFIGNSFFLQNVTDFKDAVRIDTDEGNPEKLGYNQAILKNLPLLQKGILFQNDLKEMKPEQVRSFELEYKINLVRKLYFSATYYRSIYNHFIGIKRVVLPRTSPNKNIVAAADQIANSNQHDVYYLYSNSGNDIVVQGLYLGFKFIYVGGAVIDANFTWAKLSSEVDDPVIPGFNTPEFKVNVSYLQRNFYNNVGFKVIWRWQDSFFWQSPFGDGIIDPIFTFDAQLTYKLEKMNSTLKFGVNNFINIQHVNNYGGPKMGALYFMSITFDDLFRKKQEKVASRQSRNGQNL